MANDADLVQTTSRRDFVTNVLIRTLRSADPGLNAEIVLGPDGHNMATVTVFGSKYELTVNDLGDQGVTTISAIGDTHG